jgi:hypothetical protein
MGVALPRHPLGNPFRLAPFGVGEAPSGETFTQDVFEPGTRDDTVGGLGIKTPITLVTHDEPALVIVDHEALRYRGDPVTQDRCCPLAPPAALLGQSQRLHHLIGFAQSRGGRIELRVPLYRCRKTTELLDRAGDLPHSIERQSKTACSSCSTSSEMLRATAGSGGRWSQPPCDIRDIDARG